MSDTPSSGRFLDPPPFPGFIEEMFPVRRSSWRIDTGRDAGRTVHFVDHGDPHGTPLLLIHGNPTWSFLWRKVIALLPDFRCVAPDLLGLGLSSTIDADEHTPSHHATVIASLTEALSLRDFLLVAQDWGGPIAMSVGARMPDAVRAVILGNTAVLTPTKPLRSRFHRFARVPLISDLVFRLGFPQNILHRVQGDPSSIRGEVARAYRWPLRGWGRRTAPLALARMVPDTPDHSSVPELRRGEEWIRGFAGPLALVWGTRDPILGRLLGKHERELEPAIVERTDAGHFLQEEVPETIASAIRDLAGR